MDRQGSTEAAVFNQEQTVSSWDDDYYHPIAVSYYDKAVPQLLTDMGASPGDRVLDAGCGPGVHSIRAARYGCDVTAIDLSSTMLRHARERAEAAGLSDRIDFRPCDLTNPDLGQTFDYAFSWGVIIHIPNTEAALDGLSSLIAPRGTLALQVLNEASFDYRSELFLRRLLRRPLKEPATTPLGAGNWYEYGTERLWVLRFDMQALDREMAKRGFRLLSRQTAEFSEYHRRLPGFLRAPLLHLNSFLYKWKAGTRRAATQIVIYRRDAENV